MIAGQFPLTFRFTAWLDMEFGSGQPHQTMTDYTKIVTIITRLFAIFFIGYGVYGLIVSVLDHIGSMGVVPFGSMIVCGVVLFLISKTIASLVTRDL